MPSLCCAVQVHLSERDADTVQQSRQHRALVAACYTVCCPESSCILAVLHRFTCENVMRVLRSNKDSVMAMLEAFVHDPLINWRLLNTTTDAVDANTPTGESGRCSCFDICLEDIHCWMVGTTFAHQKPLFMIPVIDWRLLNTFTDAVDANTHTGESGGCSCFDIL